MTGPHLPGGRNAASLASSHVHFILFYARKGILSDRSDVLLSWAFFKRGQKGFLLEIRIRRNLTLRPYSIYGYAVDDPAGLDADGPVPN